MQLSWAQNQPAPAPGAAPAPPATATAVQASATAQPSSTDSTQRIEQKAYVRRFSASVSLHLVPFNLFPKFTTVEKIASNPPIENDSSVDPQSNRFGLGINLQYAITERWVIAANPTYRKGAFHAFIQSYSGVDNSSTAVDERQLTQINEDTTAHFYDLPVLARYYKKDRHERGPRWFFDGGGTMRLTSNVQTVRSTVPPKGDTIHDNIPIAYNSTVFGLTGGIGGQFIDDFGIRIAPEVRYTYWLGKPFDSIHGRTRTSQLEVLISFGF
jgi:hypothetical protein